MLCIPQCRAAHCLTSLAPQGMDIYSNILYVKEAFAALSHLAQRAALTNKYRPETACIIGNYYSLKGQHEKVSLHAVELGSIGLVD